MNTKDEAFLRKLRATFQIEAREHLQTIIGGLVELERCAPEQQRGIVETVYREAHSLKGAARSVNLPAIVSLCQSVENVFAALEREALAPETNLLDLLHQAMDEISVVVEAAGQETHGAGGGHEMIRRLEEAIAGAGGGSKDQRGACAGGPGPQDEEPGTGDESEAGREAETARGADVPAPPPNTPSSSPVQTRMSDETVRISTAKLDSLLLQAEEMLSVKLSAAQRSADLREIGKVFAGWNKRRRTKGAGGGTKDAPDDGFLAVMESRLAALAKTAEYDQRTIASLVDELLEDTKKALMLPCSQLLDQFPRIVRDLAREAGKEAELLVTGGELEIDRRVLEELRDPLLHLVRNAVDHGLESGDERLRRNKPQRGVVSIGVASRDGRIEIAVADDGAGIDLPAVKEEALRRGIITQEAAAGLDDREVGALVFHSGVTTSPLITDVSGRGLGLAIVREKAEKLGGTVSLDSHPGRGTMIRMLAPLTLATFRGILVESGGRQFVIPSAPVERVVRVDPQDIRTVEGRETISFDGAAVSLSRLGEVLELPAAAGRNEQERAERVPAVVVGGRERRIAFLVDEVLQEQEVLVKPLGRMLARVRNVAAATLLGDGRVVPILNVADLVKSAIRGTGGTGAQSAVATEEERGMVLVVEDSITSRTLLKNILETAGYRVRTAVDGLDALATLKTTNCDLVVSDVQMPRMDGFALTEKIRSDAKTAEVPVVLVTALEAREDRERGIDAGANAYIVKSSFDQSNLLEVVGRLI